jgi:transglutaminase-like putative cysteine protease
MMLLAFGIFLANHWLAALQNQWVVQSIAFGLGLGLSIFSFARRLRFISLSMVLLLSTLAMLSIVEVFFPGEFSAFFLKAKVYPLIFLFGSGWLAGYGFSRSRLITSVWVVLLFAMLILVIASIAPPERKTLLLYSIPVLVYMVYILYTSELLRKMNEYQTGFSGFLAKRLGGVAIFAGILLAVAIWLLRTDFLQIEKDWEQGGTPKENNERQNSLTRNDGMGTATQPSMGLSGSNNKNNKDSVLFVAKLDHFFDEGTTPNPLYFVSDYYTLFDTVSQAFTTDTLRPYNDLIQPDISRLPLYFSFEDTAVVRQSLASEGLMEVSAEVYRVNLSPRHFTAPLTAFAVQPISVPEADRNNYRSAYRTRMLVSEMNSAYFVYNPAGDEFLTYFQEQRFSALRSIEDYSAAPVDFLDYYTEMPKGISYDSIVQLAQQITTKAEAQTPIDKVIAIRDFFLEIDENGQPLFRYSDNPGVPGIPGANKLCYFLFDSKKGYCAYYAGATLFLLRALGIPSRIATGFLTVDRSNKNPGWYWFYEDQAHAWVQVWFPGYGWLDFDTTVPSTETQEAPQPDQTPPLTTQTAWWVANGKALSIDTVRRKLNMQVNDLIYWNDPVPMDTPQIIDLDISMARILHDTGTTSLSAVKTGMDVVAVSFSDQFKNIKPDKKENWKSLIKKWPLPIPVDELKLMTAEPEKQDSKLLKGKINIPWRQAANWTLGILLCIGLCILLMPWMVYRWFAYNARHHKGAKERSYYNYMASMIYLHQLGYKKGNKTALQFAGNEIDVPFQTDFARFMLTYQKLKYSQHPISAEEERFLQQHHATIVKKIKEKIPFKKRFISFMNPAATLAFFTQPNILGTSK